MLDKDWGRGGEVWGIRRQERWREVKTASCVELRLWAALEWREAGSEEWEVPAGARYILILWPSLDIRQELLPGLQQRIRLWSGSSIKNRELLTRNTRHESWSCAGADILLSWGWPDDQDGWGGLRIRIKDNILQSFKTSMAEAEGREEAEVILHSTWSKSACNNDMCNFSICLKCFLYISVANVQNIFIYKIWLFNFSANWLFAQSSRKLRVLVFWSWPKAGAPW